MQSYRKQRDAVWFSVVLLLLGFLSGPTSADSYWPQHPGADVFAPRGSSQFYYSFMSTQESAQSALASQDGARGFYGAVDKMSIYLLEASAGHKASNSESRCGAVVNALNFSNQAYRLGRDDSRNRQVNAAGIPQETVSDNFGRRSFYGLAVSTNRRENLMNLAHAINEHDECDAYNDTPVPNELCLYALNDALIRANRIFRRIDGRYEFKQAVGPYELIPRQRNRSSVTTQELLNYCKQSSWEPEYDDEILGFILLLIEADEREEARSVAGNQNNSEFNLHLIDGME